MYYDEKAQVRATVSALIAQEYFNIDLDNLKELFDYVRRIHILSTQVVTTDEHTEQSTKIDEFDTSYPHLTRLLLAKKVGKLKLLRMRNNEAYRNAVTELHNVISLIFMNLKKNDINLLKERLGGQIEVKTM